jgi:uncharacterized protein
MTGLPNRLALLLLNVYRTAISPGLPKVCRFQPTCSTYAVQAFQTYSFLKALRLTTLRLLKCHPLHRGGYDPLP